MAIPYSNPTNLPTLDLPTEDREPSESDWHRAEIDLLIASLETHWHDHRDNFADGNVFIYTTKKTLYEQTLRTTDYFLYDSESGGFEGYHLPDGQYAPLPSDANGCLWCEQLGLWLGAFPSAYRINIKTFSTG